MPDGAKGKKGEKRQSQALRSFHTKKAAIDAHIQSIKDKDDETQNTLDAEVMQKLKVIRCRFLRVKKSNGGLTEAEEAELQVLLGGA
jgi:hypothetical protein